MQSTVLNSPDILDMLLLNMPCSCCVLPLFILLHVTNILLLSNLPWFTRAFNPRGDNSYCGISLLYTGPLWCECTRGEGQYHTATVCCFRVVKGFRWENHGVETHKNLAIVIENLLTEKVQLYRCKKNNCSPPSVRDGSYLLQTTLKNVNKKL